MSFPFADHPKVAAAWGDVDPVKTAGVLDAVKTWGKKVIGRSYVEEIEREAEAVVAASTAKYDAARAAVDPFEKARYAAFDAHDRVADRMRSDPNHNFGWLDTPEAKAAEGARDAHHKALADHPILTDSSLFDAYKARNAAMSGAFDAVDKARMQAAAGVGSVGLGGLGTWALACKKKKGSEKVVTASSEKGDGYWRQVVGRLPSGLLQATADVPVTMGEKAIRQKIVGIPNVREVVGGSMGRSLGGFATGALTAPVFFSGMKSMSSDDRGERAEGTAKVIAASTLHQYGKGFLEGLSGRGLAAGLNRAKVKSLTNIPAVLGLAMGAGSEGKAPERYGKSFLYGGLGGAAKGVAEEFLMRPNAAEAAVSLGRRVGAGAVSKGFGGAVGAVALSGILDVMKKFREAKKGPT